MAAKNLAELVSRKLTPMTALAAILEVKVETTVFRREATGKYFKSVLIIFLELPLLAFPIKSLKFITKNYNIITFLNCDLF